MGNVEIKEKYGEEFASFWEDFSKQLKLETKEYIRWFYIVFLAGESSYKNKINN